MRVSLASPTYTMEGDGSFGVYDQDPLGIIIDIFTDSYDFATILKVRLMDGRIKNITLDNHGRWDNVNLISRGSNNVFMGEKKSD